MIRGALRVINRASCQKRASQIGTFAARLANHLLVNPQIEHEALRYNSELAEQLLHTARNTNNVDIILLKSHLLAHKKLHMHLEVLLDQ
ncbi:hypothetical protein D3C80_1934200 [compost metagenome]